MKDSTPMKLQLLLTGNELMAGHTVDSNSAMMAEKLATRGFTIARKVTIGDDFEELVAELDAQSADSEVLIVNGGLGPTVDDLTAAAVAQLTDTALEEHPEALKHLRGWCAYRQLKLNDANLKQAFLPTGATIIPNPTGSAVGFAVNHNNCLILCTPGVPSELRGMLDETILDTLSERYPDHRPAITRRLQTFGIGESTLQHLLRKEFSHWPEAISVGFRAGLPQLEVKLTVSDEDHLPLLQDCEQQLKALVGDYIIGHDDSTLASAVVELLTTSDGKITTAESCTGGLIAANITQVPGASAVFEAGFVTYSNAMKTAMTNVNTQLLQTAGAVSEAVVTSMVQGAMQVSGADYGIAVSGIAGPDGGSEDKPVGTVWMAWGAKSNIKTRRLHFPGNRQWFQTMVAATGLDLIRRELLKLDTEPRYLTQRAQPGKGKD